MFLIKLFIVFITDSLRERSFVFDQLSDAFVLRILHVTFLILENCSNRVCFYCVGLIYVFCYNPLLFDAALVVMLIRLYITHLDFS